MNVAFLYDFDKTLTPRDMQEYGFIEALGIKEADAFWRQTIQTLIRVQPDSVQMPVVVKANNPCAAACSGGCNSGSGATAHSGSAARGLANVLCDGNHPQPLRDMLSKIFRGRLACDPCAPVAAPCGSPCN